jgi:eukaryotic-like serine/threonine-protein kinase
MSPERWQKIEQLYHAALEREPGGRSAFLDQACQGDVELRREAEALLAQGDAAGDSTVSMLTAGAQLGPYQIEAPIGAGGMGSVYRAVDTRLGRKVAIKICAQQFSGRFEREARAISSLNHPHICTLYDVGPNYLVMELVEGETLAARLQKGRLPMALVLRYAAEIADALAAAHALGIIHRDLKPQNIMITKSGVKVLDFGLAKTARDETLTAARVVMGTPAYMAPEQLEGKECDARSDIYALGLVLYEMAAGKRLPRGQPPLMEGLPPQFAHVIERCLESEPENRWQSASDVKRELEWAGKTADKTQVTTQGTESRKRLPRWIWGAAVSVLVLGLGWTMAHLRQPVAGAPAAGEVVSFAVYPPEKTAFSAAFNTTVNVPTFALSPDGRTIVFAAATEGAKPLLWRRPIGEVAAQALPGTEDAQHPFWSPDSQWIGFFAEGKLKKIPAAGGAVQVVTQTATDFRGGTWGPDDTIVFATGNEPLQRVTAAGGQATPASILTPQGGSHRYPQLLPDGRHFLYANISSTDQSGVYAGSLDDNTEKRLLRTSTSAVYAPPGYLLFVDGDTLLGQAFDTKRLEESGQPFLVAEHVGRSSAFLSAISASRTGTIAYAGAIPQNGRLTWLDRGGNSLGSAGPEGYYTDFRLSPDERSLAASLVDPKAGTVDVWMTDLARGSNTRLTRGGLLNNSPIWSPDGARLVFRSNRNGAIDFYLRSAAGGGNEEHLLGPEAARTAQIQSLNLVDTDWSPDGQDILFSVPGVASGNDLWLLPLTGDRKPKKYLATPAEEMHGNFSPDGRLVAYTSSESGRFQVDVQTFPLSDKKWQVSTNGGYEPRWRADGREIYYLSEDRKLMAVAVGAGPSFDVPKPLFQTRVSAGVTGNSMHYVPSRDGRRFLVNTQTGDASPTPITVVLNWTAGLKK